MHLRRSLSLLLLAAPVFALDEFQPADEGVIAVDLMNSFEKPLGLFDLDGNLVAPQGGPFVWNPGVQVRLGLPNLTEISVVVPMSVRNADAMGADEGDWGFGQSSLGFKLGIEDWGVAMVGGVEFPMGSKEMVGDDLRWRFLAGGIGHWERKKFKIDGSVVWTATPTDDKGVRRGDEWRFIARPQLQLNPMFRPYLGLVGDLQLAGKVDEKRTGEVSHLLTLEPGTFVTLNEEWSFQVQAPVTVKGDWPQSGVAGIYIGTTFNMGP
jgi:hypothetical protein